MHNPIVPLTGKNEIELLFDQCISDVENDQHKTEKNKDLQIKALWRFHEFCRQENIKENSQLRNAALLFLQKDTFSGMFTKAGVKPAVFRICEIANVRAPTTDEIKDQSHKIIDSRLRSRSVNKLEDLRSSNQSIAGDTSNPGHIVSSIEIEPNSDSKKEIQDIIVNVKKSFPSDWSEEFRKNVEKTLDDFGIFTKGHTISEIPEMISEYLQPFRTNMSTFQNTKSKLKKLTDYLKISMPNITLARQEILSVPKKVIRGSLSPKPSGIKKPIAKSLSSNNLQNSQIKKLFQSVMKSFQTLSPSTVKHYTESLMCFENFCAENQINSLDQLQNACFDHLGSIKKKHVFNKARTIVKRILKMANMWKDEMLDSFKQLKVAPTNTDLIPADFRLESAESHKRLVGRLRKKPKSSSECETNIVNETENVQTPIEKSMTELVSKNDTTADPFETLSISLICASVLEKYSNSSNSKQFQEEVLRFADYFNIHKYRINEIELALTNYKEDLFREKEAILSKIYNTFLFQRNQNIPKIEKSNIVSGNLAEKDLDVKDVIVTSNIVNENLDHKVSKPKDINHNMMENTPQTVKQVGASSPSMSSMEFVTTNKKAKVYASSDNDVFASVQSEIYNICQEVVKNLDCKPSTIKCYSLILDRFVLRCHNWKLFKVGQLKEGIRRFVQNYSNEGDNSKIVLRKVAKAAGVDATSILGRGRRVPKKPSQSKIAASKKSQKMVRPILRKSNSVDFTKIKEELRQIMFCKAQLLLDSGSSFDHDLALITFRQEIDGIFDQKVPLNVADEYSKIKNDFCSEIMAEFEKLLQNREYQSKIEFIAQPDNMVTATEDQLPIILTEDPNPKITETINLISSEVDRISKEKPPSMNSNKENSQNYENLKISQANDQMKSENKSVSNNFLNDASTQLLKKEAIIELCDSALKNVDSFEMEQSIQKFIQYCRKYKKNSILNLEDTLIRFLVEEFRNGNADSLRHTELISKPANIVIDKESILDKTFDYYNY
eukprot:NODE_28_length_38599_cov_0.791792.p1 type:complete len:1007 gc:universal NODE_28_length_38599_cov_0.791792:32618-35638(+)